MPGERWLDAECGSGETALRAARAGAAVTAIGGDVDEARGRAGVEGLDIAFRVREGDRLPFSDDAFDVLVSCFGDVPAHELARVTRTRFGFTAWEAPSAVDAFSLAVFERVWDGRSYALVIGRRA